MWLLCVTSAKDWVWSDLYVPVSSAALGHCKGLLLSAFGFYKDGGRFLSIEVKAIPGVIPWRVRLEATSLRGKASIQVRYLVLKGFPQQTTHAASREAGKVEVRATEVKPRT